MRKISLVLLFVLAAVLLIPSVAVAHPGRTDSNGGHYNRSTGEYHYHHGYPAHDHPGGVCPYEDEGEPVLSFTDTSTAAPADEPEESMPPFTDTSTPSPSPDFSLWEDDALSPSPVAAGVISNSDEDPPADASLDGLYQSPQTRMESLREDFYDGLSGEYIGWAYVILLLMVPVVCYCILVLLKRRRAFASSSSYVGPGNLLETYKTFGRVSMYYVSRFVVFLPVFVFAYCSYINSGLFTFIVLLAAWAFFSFGPPLSAVAAFCSFYISFPYAVSCPSPLWIVLYFLSMALYLLSYLPSISAFFSSKKFKDNFFYNVLDIAQERKQARAAASAKNPPASARQSLVSLPQKEKSSTRPASSPSSASKPLPVQPNRSSQEDEPMSDYMRTLLEDVDRRLGTSQPRRQNTGSRNKPKSN